jgi:hypothetical protein
MLNHLRGNVVAYLALSVALGGTSYAAVKLPRNSVGTTQIKADAVTSAKVRNGSLLAKDFKAGQLRAGPQGAQGPQGPQGPQGEKGDTGAAGSALAYAHLLVSGSGVTVDAARTKGVAQANVSRATTGVVCIKGLSFTPRSVAAIGDAAQSGPLVVAMAGLAPDAAVLAVCGGDGQAALAIQTVGDTPANVDHDLYVTLN